MYTYRFEWYVKKCPAGAARILTARPSAASSVYVTGNFDGWSKSTQLIRDGDVFTGYLRVPDRQKLVFKFVVDDIWLTSDSYKVEKDASGIDNNYVDAEELSVFEEFDKEDEATGVDAPEDAGAASGNLQPDAQHDARSNSGGRPPSDPNNLAQVLTSAASFAAVSIPSETKSDPVGAHAFVHANVADSTLDRHHDSGTPTANATPTASQIIKPPGAYPESPAETPSSSVKSTPRKESKSDSLVQRFRSLFK